MKSTIFITIAALLLTMSNFATAQLSAKHGPDASYGRIYTATPDIASISVYNNPESKLLVMDYETQQRHAMKLTVYDAHGQQYVVKTVNNRNGSQRITLDISELFKGGYFLILEGEDYKETRRFIVLK